MGETEYTNPHITIDPKLHEKMIETANQEHQKPWNLVKTLEKESKYSENEIRKALKRLMLDGDLYLSSKAKVKVN